MESLRQLQVSLRRSVRKFISISEKDGKDWGKSRLLNVISSLKTTLYDVNDCITVGLKLSDTLAWYGSILNGSDHNFVRSKECYLDLQANFHHLKHNESEQNPHKVKQRSVKWHSIRDQAYVTGSTMHKALGLDTLKKQQEHFDFVVNHKMKKDELTQEEIENIQFGTNNEINAIATLVCKIMPLYCPNTCYTEFGCHVIDYKGKPFCVVSPDGAIRESQVSEPIFGVEVKCRRKRVNHLVSPVYYTIPEYYILQIMLEMKALNTESLLFLCWSEESCVCMKVSFNE